MQSVTVGIDEAGAQTPVTNSWTEIATGLNYLTNGQWIATEERFQEFNDGFTATEGPHQLILTRNINAPGSVDLLLPEAEGQPERPRLRSNPMGLSFFDSVSGRNVLLGEVQDCEGQLVAPNVVVFGDAFTNIAGAIRYTYTRSGISQDVILYGSPGSPEEYGLDPTTTLLEMYTEFFDPPAPEITSQPMEGGLQDQNLEFGTMGIGRGVAYVLGQELESTPVTKTWSTIAQRHFLVESVPWSTAKLMLDKLVATTGSTNKAGFARQTFPDRQTLVASAAMKRKSGSLRVASAKPVRLNRGFVLDYTTLNSTQTNFVFAGTTTYYVSGTVNLTSTSTFEGGAVIKYTNSANAQLTVPNGSSAVFSSSAYRPVIFTAKDDNTVGDTISGSTGTPTNYYANPAFSINLSSSLGAPTLANLRVAYAKQALSIYGIGYAGTHPVVRNAQLVNCQNGINVAFSIFNVRNTLFTGVLTNFNGMNSSTTICENVTCSSANWLNNNPNLSLLIMTNSLLVAVTNTLNYTGSYNYAATNAATVFQSVGAGNCYLADNTYRNVGSTNIDATLAADLKTMTTYPPVNWTGDFVLDTIVKPQALRDTDVPDIGYHYWPLDYCWTGLNVTNATVFLTNGVAVGVYGNQGVTLLTGGNLISEGTPNSPNRLVRYQAVQEQPALWGASPAYALMLANVTSTNSRPVLSLRFTDLPALSGTAPSVFSIADDAFSNISVTDCTLRGSSVSLTVPGAAPASPPPVNYLTIQNNVFERGTVGLYRAGNGKNVPVVVSVYNDLFWHGLLDMIFDLPTVGSTPAWTFGDTAFDNSTITWDGTATNTITRSYNGFINTTNPLGGTSNIVLSTFTYATGALGPWYQSTTNFVDKGSRLASLAGLYHYTARTSQAKETNSTVDIGFHYVSVNGSNLPIDTDGDGLADYFEDRNGNGTVDTGESDPAVVDSDYDGRTDYQEWLEGTNPTDAASVTQTRLGYWRFNTSNFAGEQGQMPIVNTNVQNVASFDGNGLQVTNSAGVLKYAELQTNFAANLNCRQGSIRLMYKPYWTGQNAGGTGPGAWAQLVEMGSYTTNASVGWFSLSIDPAGTNIWFFAQDNAGHSYSNNAALSSTNALGTTNSLGTFNWSEIQVTYSTNHLQIWKDGNVLDTNVSSLPLPPANVRAQGFTVGSSINGNYPAKGLIDEFETMNYPLGRGEAEFETNRVLSATAVASPAAINLEWRTGVLPAYMNLLQRRSYGATNWTNLATNYAWHFSDSGVTVGQKYEYYLSVPNYPEFDRYLVSGVNLPPVENRGKVILLADITLTNALVNELAQLKQDLAGDGWTVIRYDVPRHIDDYSTSTSFLTNAWNIANVIKQHVVTNYNADPTNTKMVFIVGHVSIPYSGFAAEDGHDYTRDPFNNHFGAWPSDIYYGDVDGIWTDNLSYPTNTPVWSLETTNTMNDGKFDQSNVPTNSSGIARIELAVGRVDFARLPIFTNPPAGITPKTETDLLKQYFNKNHRYRHKFTNLPLLAIVKGAFVGGQEDANPAVYINATLNSSRMFSFVPGSTIEGDIFTDKRACLWGIQGAPGSPSTINVVHTSASLADPANEPPVGFYLLKGSWFGDWNLVTDNFLRSVLGTTNYGLASMWFMGANWRLESMAMGDTLGDGLLRTANSTDVYTSAQRSLAIMGDPTLRLHVTAPVSNLVATNSGTVALLWTPSLEMNALYLVYRSTNSLDGPFLKLTSSPISAASYVDASPPAGTKTYQVRALNLVISGSGSYTNLSQGVFVTTN